MPDPLRPERDVRRVRRWLSACMASMRRALNRPYITSTSTNANGSPMMMVAFCSAGTPPTMSIPTVSRPVATAQKMRTHGAPSDWGVFRCEVRLAITSAAESAEVT